MGKDQMTERRDPLSLAIFVAGAGITRPQTSATVERLKLACKQDSGWNPMLDPADLSFRRALQDVRSELGRSFDDSELMTWLASPNVWLQSRVPADLLGSDVPSVLVAARTDRFVAEG
jgi:hypothetical protein